MSCKSRGFPLLVTLWCIDLGILLCGAAPVHAQEGPAAQPGTAAPPSPAPSAAQSEGTTSRNVPAVRLSSPPVIDGDLSDPVWQEAAKADRWVDWLNANPNIDQTVVSVGYDDRNLYLAWYAYDSQPSEIVAQQTKRGAFPAGDDWIDLNLDLFHTHKFSDFCFFYVNPIGTRFARLAGGRATKLEWEGDWQSAGRIVADGYTVEMAIPWAILNYPAVRKPTTIGINFLRYHKRLNMISNWSNIGPNDQHPEFTGHLTGLELPRFRPQFSLLPYVIPGWQEESGFGLRSGLDLRSRLRPTLTMVGTVNPDFENVEEAVEGIDFSYGPRFVPDRRPFFQEGGGIFDIGSPFLGSVFYSRRIGIFDAGWSLFGKLTPRDTVGMLATLDLGRRADWILRGRHELGSTAWAGLGLINRDDEEVSNRVLILEEDFRRGRWGADANWVNSWVDSRHTGDAGNLFLYYQSPRWFAKVEPHFVRPGFRDDLGFIPFTDFKGVNNRLEHNREWRTGPLRFFSAGLNTFDSHHYDGRLFRQGRELFADLQTRSDYSLRLGWDTGRFEEFDDSVFSVNLGARARDPFHRYGLGYSWGRRADEPITFLTPYITWRFGERFTVGLSSAILNHTEDLEQHVFTFNYDLSPQQGIGGRIVSQTGGTNGYLAYRRSGYGGIETFLILGDPNALKFRERVVLKVVWAM
jgi:hypothetical protein